MAHDVLQVRKFEHPGVGRKRAKATPKGRQVDPTAAPTDAKPSKMKLTAQKLKDMKAKWSANKPKLKACRAEVKAKGLAGDDRWFFIADCMDKT